MNLAAIMYPPSFKGPARLHLIPLLHHRMRPTQFVLDGGLRKGTLTPDPSRSFHCSALVSSGNGRLCHLEDLWHAWEGDSSSTMASMQLLLLMRDYQVYGHMMAAVDPVGLDDVPDDITNNLELYGFTEADLDREFFLGGVSSRFLSSDNNKQTLREMVAKLRRAYCGSIGYEYMHIPDREKREWLRDRIESSASSSSSSTNLVLPCCLVILERLVRATRLESFLAETCPDAKRYGLAGAETLIPGMEALLDKAADFGVESVVMGTSHRGRLNVMANVFRLSVARIISELTVGPRPAGGGDVYAGTGELYFQQGVSCDRPITRGGLLHLSLVAQPCHLEAVDPVVMGKTRAKQFYSGDVERTRTMAVLVHGDGAFAGQGVVYETLNLSALRGYTTGGTVHIVLNNRVTATADQSAGRSSRYCTDVAKALGAPVFHVNGDDVEAVVRACELAAEWRHTFHSDVVVDLICYRRFGHNELDDPTITLPKMYKVINNHPSSLNLYQQMLQETGQISSEQLQMIHDTVNKNLNQELAKSKDYVPNERDWLSANWVNLEQLKRVGQAITTLPKTFKPHKTASQILEQRGTMLQSGQGIDWAFAEALAFATLVAEGTHVRLSGQDVERGNFNQRHGFYMTRKPEKSTAHSNMLSSIRKRNCLLLPTGNSLLSEFAVLGFEMGYSMENPNSLVLWEAQFGDFANCAQVIFDQFLCCAEARWLRQTGLVVLLPHGYDGVGPDHSGAHLERFLQMCDDNPFIIPEMKPSLCRQIQECNWQVVNVTTPANYFHVLRRQVSLFLIPVHRNFRKPLIVMTPKNLLWHKDCKSNLSEFNDVQGRPNFNKERIRFKRLITDTRNHKQVDREINRLILCSGKVSSLYAEIMWCQEEPMNMGAYSYIVPRLHTAMKALGRGSFNDIKYVGRLPSAAAATGFPSVHIQEQLELVKKALQPEPIKFP
ncbi:hypothetical protein PR202_ga22954 [Eleusine coracana subsp. coracana]|uniref:Transketolase-like pyrimidine-binding domain-containing protein n=1 Tax=Eleusine coracana subsp. coracana TaxID=191504 RepID=A0AAV5D596_ELECO|nr:hypothetical protein PR202_ga22954 [Eleusine coracana subsp. coracana]